MYEIHLVRTQTTKQSKKAWSGFVQCGKSICWPNFTFEDNRQNYGEQRWVTLGLFRLRVVVIIHTETQE
jgi:hypothetical protein